MEKRSVRLIGNCVDSFVFAYHGGSNYQRYFSKLRCVALIEP